MKRLRSKEREIENENKERKRRRRGERRRRRRRRTGRRGGGFITVNTQSTVKLGIMYFSCAIVASLGR